MSRDREMMSRTPLPYPVTPPISGRPGIREWVDTPEGRIEVTSSDDRFCPECGAGIESHAGHMLTARVPKGFPFNEPCKACDARLKAAFEQLGRDARAKVEARVLEVIGR